jgi:hypothetical protein
MGAFDFLFGNKDGMDCSEDPQTGALTCRKFKVDKNSKIATGSEATIILDDHCRASFAGKFSVLTDDEVDFQRIAKKRESACKGGLI